MTLTALMPSLRASLPDPFDATCWPVHTEPTVSDVRVSAVSMSRLADVAGTPCVHTAEEAPPRWRPRDWTPSGMSVTVAAVTGVALVDGTLQVALDAVVPGCGVLDEVRLIGRCTTAPAVVTRITTTAPTDADDPAAEAGRAAVLPSDVAVGDLVCFPCRRALTHRDVAGIVPAHRDEIGTETAHRDVAGTETAVSR